MPPGKADPKVPPKGPKEKKEAEANKGKQPTVLEEPSSAGGEGVVGGGECVMGGGEGVSWVGEGVMGGGVGVSWVGEGVMGGGEGVSWVGEGVMGGWEGVVGGRDGRWGGCVWVGSCQFLGKKSFSCLAEVLKTCQNLIYCYLTLNTFK